MNFSNKLKQICTIYVSTRAKGGPAEGDDGRARSVREN
ncbi:unnamed protein product [Urochloa humidicola]